jgi:DNA-binding NarL/FixJ family response regulator
MSAAFEKALIVEDDPGLRRALVRGLRSWGVETLEAANVRAARRLLRCEPDLVVTDVRLPDGTGLEVASRAARLHAMPMIVAMSGEATPAEAFELAQLTVRVYLQKPFTLEEMARRIDEEVARDEDREAAPWEQAIPEAIRATLTENVRRLAAARALTRREAHLVRLAVAGVARSELPHAMGVSNNTAKTLIRRVLRKCGLRRVAELPGFVLAAGAQ